MNLETGGGSCQLVGRVSLLLASWRRRGVGGWASEGWAAAGRASVVACLRRSRWIKIQRSSLCALTLVGLYAGGKARELMALRRLHSSGTQAAREVLVMVFTLAVYMQ